MPVARKPERQGLVIFERGGDQFGKADGLQHGFGGKEPHPDLEYLWIDLERIVEAAKYQGVLRQAAFGPIRQTVGDGTLVVIGPAIRQPHHAFAVETEMLKSRCAQGNRRGEGSQMLFWSRLWDPIWVRSCNHITPRPTGAMRVRGRAPPCYPRVARRAPHGCTNLVAAAEPRITHPDMMTLTLSGNNDESESMRWTFIPTADENCCRFRLICNAE